MSADDEESRKKKVAAKIEWIERRRAMSVDRAVEPGRQALPPGQTWSDRKWPVLDLGDQPAIERDDWELIVDGRVLEPKKFSFDELCALGEVESSDDFHCVTTWSTRGNRWKGVRFARLMEEVLPDPSAKFVLLTSYDTAPDTGENYTTNLPLEALLDDDVLLVHSWNGEPLTREHGGPVRLFVPKRYAWKSAKWLWRITLLERDLPGYWEVRGYSNSADPWTDDRYGRMSLFR